MGEVVSLAEARRARTERRRALAEHAVMHPALRWLAGGDGLAHRRTRDGRTVCGTAGQLVLADADAEHCPHCYPRLAR